MDEREPDNLKLLHGAFGEDLIEAILPGETFTVDGVEFVCKYTTGSTADRFYIVKNLALVARYRELCERFHGGNFVELGIAEGGSTALLALLAHPNRLVAVDLEPVPLAALTEFTERRGLGDMLHAYWGIDQSDCARLGAAVDEGLDGQPIDVVFDDCSHQYEPTRSSFECLFPRLRPGGLFVIEDWNADHVFRDAMRKALTDPNAPDREERMANLRTSLRESRDKGTVQHHDPLTRLAMELAVARSSLTDAIARVSLDEFWIVVERGPAELAPGSFRLDEECHDYFGFLPARSTASGGG